MVQDDNATRAAPPDTGLRVVPSSPANELVPVNPEVRLPVPVAKRPPPRKRWLRAVLALAVILGGAGGGYYWWQHVRSQLPAGIAFGNGRLEADEIDIDTKYAGRIAEILADEGDLVKAGQVVARMDTRDLEASLKKSQSQVKQARRAVDEANANETQQNSLVLLGAAGIRSCFAPCAERFPDQGSPRPARTATRWRQCGAHDRSAGPGHQAEHARDAATHDVELYSIQIADNTLVAPRDGRIQYRISNIGEVLPAGGKVFAMLDTSDVYMDIYLPTEAAGKAKFGADARIVLDAYPKIAIPAKVSFIATQAQFTPKTVETQSERDKLMFRIRVRIDPERLRTRADEVRSGLPGVAYVLTNASVKWPPALQGPVTQ